MDRPDTYLYNWILHENEIIATWDKYNEMNWHLNDLQKNMVFNKK